KHDGLVGKTLTVKPNKTWNLIKRIYIRVKSVVFFSEMYPRWSSRIRFLLFPATLFGALGLFILLKSTLSSLFTFECQNNCDSSSQSNEPFIFIGGYPRSGTTLMRVLLDVHPSIRCGPETHILPHFLYLYSSKIAPLFDKRLHEANISHELVDSIYVSMISGLLHKTGPDAKRLCVKDPFIDFNLKYLLHLFPNGKFILMVRDGRAVANSIISRTVRIVGVDTSNPEKLVKTWNSHYKYVTAECEASERCMIVRYEELVLRPRETLGYVLAWLDVPWDEVVMQHDQNMGEVKLSRKEKSTQQVVFPIYTEALNQWALPGSKISQALILRSQSMEMMKYFGYANLSIPPVYGIPEPEVLRRSQSLRMNAEFKKLFDSLH
uniref:Protein-tyrosine sulfotransferase n=1 Tax=Mesocestoides corti TaxID=53468 RepID=A0A5K3EF79_MESCO